MGWAALAVLGLAMLAFPAAVYLLQDGLIFHPQPLDEARRAGIAHRFPDVQELSIENEAGRLHAWHIPGDPLILYFGGNAEDVSWMIEEAKEKAPGVGWLLTSYRGYGASEGAPSEKALFADALRWYDHVMKTLSPSRVIAFGRSLGSGAAVYLASQREVASVILVSPYDSLAQVAKGYYPVLPVGLMLRHRFDSISRAPAIRAPLLCLVATHDEVISPAHSRRLFDAWGGPKQWVDVVGAGHNGMDGAEGFWQSIQRFLEESRPEEERRQPWTQ